MKNKILLVFLILISLTGCTKSYTSVPDNKFLSTFENRKEYKLVNNSVNSEGIYKKSYEIGNGKISFYYLEFSTNKKAKDYMKLSYKNRNFHYKEKDNYIIAKRKISKLYIKAIKVDNIIIIGMSNKFKDRFEVNKIFKEFNM